MIRVPGKGEEGHNGGAPGDLYLRVRFAQQPDFRVRGSDLYYDLDLAPWEAVLGTNVTIPALDGPVTVRIPPGTSNGQQLRVRGKGLPAAGGTRGGAKKLEYHRSLALVAWFTSRRILT